MKKHKINNGTDFLEWLETLQPWQLLDLAMNCMFLLGKTVTPPEQKEAKPDDNTQN